MATKKKPAPKSTDTTTAFKQDKVEEVEVKALLKDERTFKVAGSLFLLIAILLFVAFTSYLFTWDEDQDKVFKDGSKLLLGTETEVANLMGTFGAYISHLLMYRGFGIAAYLLCSLFFIMGINLFIGRKFFSLGRNLRYLIVGLPLISLAASVIMGNDGFPWGGAVGDYSKKYLITTIGQIGTYALLITALIAYLIWRFNPSFNFSSSPKNAPSPRNFDGGLINDNDDLDRDDAAEDEENNRFKPKPFNSNSAAGGLVASGVPKQPGFSHDLNIIERQEPIEAGSLVETPMTTTASAETGTGYNDLNRSETVGPKKSILPVSEAGIELEIKPTGEAVVEAPAVPLQKIALQDPYDPSLELRNYKFPTVDLLDNHGTEKIIHDPQELENNKNQIIHTLRNYDIEIQKIFATIGPTVTLYEIIPAAGVRISRIKNLEDDIALSLAALGIRIIAPIPGKGTIGIEVPNTRKTLVSMRGMLSSDKFKQNKYTLPIALGKKIDNENFIVDLASMPHLLMAGATGQGKSVGINAVLVSLLYSKHPSQIKFVLVDPKKVELSIYKTIEKHFLAKLPGEEDAIITDTKKVVHTLNALCIEMDTRYDLLKEAGCRNIREYNEKFVARKLNPEKGHQFLPFIILVIDEFADLIMTAGKEIEMPIARLAQLARAIGIHLIIATQRPSVNIITGIIKANFPARIAFKVSSKIDSRTILDIGGAEQLIGKGDMLVSYNGELVRVQCAFVDTPEVDRVTDFIGEQRGYPQAFQLPEYVDEKELDGRDFDVNDKDALFEDAARLIVNSQSGSTSLIQRKMKLGYNRAGRIMDQLEAAGIVGAGQGSKPRDVLIKTEMELQDHLSNLI